MINLAAVMKVLNERKTFLDNHPEIYAFIKKEFGDRGLCEGDLLEIAIKRPGEENARKVEIEVQKSEQPFFDAVRDVVK